MKKIVILSILLVVIFLAAWLLFPERNNTEGTGAGDADLDFPAAPRDQTSQPPERQVEAGFTGLGKRKDTDVEVRDFTKDKSVVEWTDETFLLADRQGDESSLYQIFYFPAYKQIKVSLLSEPLNETRLLAETELKSILQIPESEICNFDISVSAPLFVSEKYAGLELGVSFCPGSTVLK